MSKDEEKREQQLEQEQETTMPAASTSGNSNPCPICLAIIPHLEESYLDHCFHRFCYKCIVQWTKVYGSKYSEPPAFVTCPLCKTKNSSILYGYDGNSFQRHYISKIYTDSVFLSEAHKFRLRCYYTRQGSLDDTFNVQRFWRSRRYLHPNKWLYSWVKREVQALIQEEDVELIVHHILGTIDSFLKRDRLNIRKQVPELVQQDFQAVVSEAARLFLADRAERFVDEMELFMASGLNLEAYDEVYKEQLDRDTSGSGGGSPPEGVEFSETSRVALNMFECDDTSNEI